MKLSIVVPMYNEEQRVEKTVNSLNKYLAGAPFEPEVIFVDDGSTDRTISKLESLPRQFGGFTLFHQTNFGKGKALKTGILKSQGDYVLFMDADMSTPIEELIKFLPECDRGTEMVIGSRKTRGANVLKHQHPWRQKLGEGFTLLSNFLLVPGITDFTCGFKLMRMDVAKKIFGSQKIERWGYDSEIIFLAKKYGYKVVEIPVTWSNDDRTRVNLFKDVWRSFTDLIKIRYYDLTNQY